MPCNERVRGVFLKASIFIFHFVCVIREKRTFLLCDPPNLECDIF